ncbi:hypothetical protein BDN70DRAFT_902567 [Pholiota conissans]|uniref:Uncharacterized protein n=1 Tax=Pholiota conissans TaxID=109636 RepID=A0A9P5ZG13_9AGAR|nr:hypothetical protein BDN70DRAFT_902567 [Pholiota conissans]
MATSLVLPAFSVHAERKLGETEVSYFLPSRESGVNDMYLHLGCTVPSHLVERQRVLVAWAIMRIRHPLLASSIRMKSYDDISFQYDAPHSPNAALALANRHLEYREQSKDDQNVDFLICATHFLGDGMALHRFASDFFALLGSTLDQEALDKLLAMEWSESFYKKEAPSLPQPMEDRLPPCIPGRLRAAASRIDFELNQQKLVGGHHFPKNSRGPRRTVVPTICIEPYKTKLILKYCKDRGVSISAALFALCNIAWARTRSGGWELPVMMYSALNMRPNLIADKKLNDSYWFLAIGYFNVVLPSFFPGIEAEGHGKLAGMFWHRARAAKAQSIQAAKSPLIVSRCRQMAVERGRRARVWAKEDDDKLAGVPSHSAAPIVSGPVPIPLRPNAPSTALMGLSLLGNLDGIYKHSNFPDFKFHTLTTGSRQRSGGMLLFGYTFADKLWISFGYDANGFEETTVQKFWENIVDGVEEFLVPA